MMKTQLVRMPLVHDHHSHPLLYASFAAGVSLESATTKAEAMARIRSVQAGRPGDLLLIHGWRNNLYPWTAAELDSLGAVAVFNLSLHSLLLSHSAAEQLTERYGEDVHRIGDQAWYEANFRTVLNWFAHWNGSVDTLRQFFDGLLDVGVYSAEELLLVDGDEIRLFERAGLLDRTRFWADPRTFEQLLPEERSRVHGLKLFTDGAIGAHTAALNRRYLDDPDNRGILMYSDDELKTTVKACLSLHRRLAVHAIGDRALEQLITTLESVDLSGADQVRIEHAQLIDRSQAERAKALGVILSMQPNFSSDSEHYADRLDEAACRANNPFRMLIDEAGFVPGVDLVFGSDGMPHGVQAAAEQCFGSPIPGQRVTPEELIAAYDCRTGTPGEIEIEIRGDQVSTQVRR